MSYRKIGLTMGLIGALGLCVASAAMAKVSPEEAARLGQDLTPMGSEKAGNADGTIPAWDGGHNPGVDTGTSKSDCGEARTDQFCSFCFHGIYSFKGRWLIGSVISDAC